MHIVKSGDTISKIAALYGVTIDDILAANLDDHGPEQDRARRQDRDPAAAPVRDRGRGDHARSLAARRQHRRRPAGAGLDPSGAASG